MAARVKSRGTWRMGWGRLEQAPQEVSYERRGPFPPSNVSKQQYDSVRAELEGAVEWPAEGCQLHVVFGQEDDIRVSEVWESAEKQQAFGESLRREWSSRECSSRARLRSSTFSSTRRTRGDSSRSPTFARAALATQEQLG
jgi:hypothetical protein